MTNCGRSIPRANFAESRMRLHSVPLGVASPLQCLLDHKAQPLGRQAPI